MRENYELMSPLAKLFTSAFDYPFNNESHTLKTNIKKDDKQIVFDIEVPGYQKEDLDIELRNGYLTISANKKNEKEETKDGYLCKECFYGTQERSYYVGKYISGADIKASLDKGILHLVLPLSEKEEIKKISID